MSSESPRPRSGPVCTGAWRVYERNYLRRRRRPVSKLGNQLMRAPIPESIAGERRAMALARGAVIEASAPLSVETRPSWRAGRVRVALATLLVAVLAVATP